MKTDLFKSIEEDEIENILNRRTKLNKYHPYLYRGLLDIIGCSNSKEETYNKFYKWAKLHYNITKFNSILYVFFITCRLNMKSIRVKGLVKELKDNHYIYEESIIDCDFYDRFDTEVEAIKWLISYRATRTYHLQTLYDSYNDK